MPIAAASPRPLCTSCPLSSDRLLAIIRFQTEVAKAGLDLAEVLERVPPLAQELTRASGAVVELADGDEMVYRAASGTASGLLGLRLPLQGSLSGRCAAQGEVLLCEDSERDPRVNLEACRKVGLRSMAVVPLRHRGVTVGVMKVLSGGPAYFRDVDVQTLELISEVIGATMVHAVEHATKVEEARDLFLRATRDTLTGLGNRALFFDHLHRALAQARRDGRTFGVALLDMDGLKSLNDLHGHAAGDAALRTLAQRIQGAARQSDIIARLGGDEFGLLLPGLPGPDAAGPFAAKLAHRAAGPFEFEGRIHPLEASAGVALWPGDGEDPDALIAAADRAMYRMKRERKASRP